MRSASVPPARWARSAPDARSALPALTAALKDKDLEVRHFAARALVRVGDAKARQAAAPVLREVLAKGAADQRLHAKLIVLLWEIGGNALPDLEPGDLNAAMQMLRGVYSKAADEEIRRNAVPTLVAAFGGTKDAGHRAYLAQTLGAIGSDAGAAVPALRAALEDPDVEVRKEAAEALKKIEKQGMRPRQG